MAKHTMKNPARLSHGELAQIATGMLQILYGQQHRDGSWTYAADKEWSGGDVCEAAAGLLGHYGLVPEADGHGEPMEPAAILESRSQGSKSCRYILYDFDEGTLATTMVYDEYAEAAADADQLNNVVILAVEFEEEHPEPRQREQPPGEPGPSD